VIADNRLNRNLPIEMTCFRSVTNRMGIFITCSTPALQLSLTAFTFVGSRKCAFTSQVAGYFRHPAQLPGPVSCERAPLPLLTWPRLRAATRLRGNPDWSLQANEN
jgi:hypothetical protein